MTAPDKATIAPLGVAAVCVLFAVAYGQAPLYYSNQNQYFLHGLATAGDGLLHEDWLAGTLDPTPVFSGLVAGTATVFYPWMFHVYYALLQGVYLAALLGLFATLAGTQVAERRWLVFAALLVTVHSAAGRWLSYRLLGQDYPWYLQAGVAGQYLLGAMFQPSTFGVLLVLSIALFVRQRQVLAVIVLAAAATVHSTYLLPGALLTLGFLSDLAIRREYRRAIVLGSLALGLVLPVTIHVLVTFVPTSAATFAEAQEILVNFRIPHHCRTDLWLDSVAVLQLAWMGFAVLLTYGTPLLVPLAVSYGLMLALTGVQAVTGSNTLALLFPWRIAAVLVPVATTVILARLVAVPRLPLDRKAANIAAAVVLVAVAAGGGWIMASGSAFRSGADELALMDFVRQTKRSGDVYFLPVQVPDLAKTTRGSLSSDFKPLAEKRADQRLIPPDLQRFRLATEAPIYVDFKAIPYKDVEVLEWRRRLAQAEGIQQKLRTGKFAEAQAELRRIGVTHLVLPAAHKVSAPGLEQIFADETYAVMRVIAP